jgi:hypothetical protein
MTNRPFRALDHERDIKAIQRIWIECGWIRDEDEDKKIVSDFFKTGDINIEPSFTYFDPRKLLAQLSQEDMDYLTHEGEKSTWHRLEQIRLSSKIGKTLDVILDEHTANNVMTTYKKRTLAKEKPGKKLKTKVSPG